MPHARGTARTISAIDPDRISLLSLMLADGAPLTQDIQRNEFVLPDPTALLDELRQIIPETASAHPLPER